ncbi:MAG: RNA polymerase sigma factor [Candidatus Gastranaerophilaceae bacterium]
MVQSYERDELRGRFTRFMEVMVKRARLNYLEKMRRQPITVPLDDVPETLLADDTAFPTDVSGDFDFEEERLANAFSQLPLMRQKILIMLFAEELAPKEIARRMNCSVNHVYNQRSLAIKRLRQLLEEGGEEP